MSVSSLPEWKQLLLERKRREEEERERREKEEEDKLANMPAWKRGIIQRRKAKQENLGDREKDKDPKPASQVSMETIVPVHENPFIRTQSVWRKGRDAEIGNESDIKDKDKSGLRGQDVETNRGRDTELKIERGETAYKASPEVTKENQQEAQTGSLTQEATTRSPKRITPFGMLQGPLEIQIPRTVFYVAEDMVERKKSECQSSDGQDRDGGQQVERRDSWRVGKPLSRIESLREKIRQRELEKQRQREAQGGAAETCDAQTGEVGYEERGSEQEREWEAAACEQTRPVDAERMQEEAAEQTSTTACDSPRRNCSPTSQLKQTVTPPFQRTQSPENSLKPANCAPTPASSPSLSSPSNSPSASPSPTPSPKLFTIKSASGGMVKRGATVTITPRRPVAGRVTDSKPRPTAAESTKGSSQPTTPAVDEPVKKKYPAVEEIKVIGGYQHLEKSCLVKNRGTPKNVSCVSLLFMKLQE
uniref:Phostensin n=1 Tax=Nothobranchius furzeri TaxID=105023 RepID=A0A8C6M4F0_NOTFU